MCLEIFSKNIFVLNLQKREDRLEHIRKQLKKINCENYTVINSIDGSSISNPTSLKNGMYGLILTYIELYNSIKNNSPQELIIIEDDCVFHNDFCEEVVKYFENIPSDWSILYFGGNHNVHGGHIPPLKINDNVLKVHSTFSAHCIVIKFSIFEELVKNLMNFNIENDVLMSRIQKEKSCYTTSKKITWQINTHSDIEDRYVNYDWLLKDGK